MILLIVPKLSQLMKNQILDPTESHSLVLVSFGSFMKLVLYEIKTYFLKVKTRITYFWVKDLKTEIVQLTLCFGNVKKKKKE